MVPPSIPRAPSQMISFRPRRDRLPREGIDNMLTGDIDTGKAILRDYIKATVGFEKLGRGDRQAAQEPHPHVRPARQSAGAQPVQRVRLSAEAGGVKLHAAPEPK